MRSKSLPSYEQVGRRIKEERLRAGLTLNELAKRVGVSTSYISLVENSKSVPSLKILDQICTSLSIHISMLFAEHEEKVPDSFAVFRDDTHVSLNVSDKRLIRVLMPKDNLPLKAVQVVIQPGDSHDSFSTHEGIEFGFVVRGRIDLSLKEQDGEEKKITCNRGDSFIYDAMRPHRFINRGDTEVELMLIALSNLTMEDRISPSSQASG